MSTIARAVTFTEATIGFGEDLILGSQFNITYLIDLAKKVGRFISDQPEIYGIPNLECIETLECYANTFTTVGNEQFLAQSIWQCFALHFTAFAENRDEAWWEANLVDYKQYVQ